MRSLGPLAVMLILSGALIGFTVSLFVPHRYAATAEIAFLSAPGVTHESYAADARKLYESSLEVTLLPQSLELMIRRSPAFKERLYIQSFSEVLEDVRKNLSVSTISVSGGLSGAKIEFDDDDSDTALDLVREVVSQMGDNAAAVAGAKKASDVLLIVKTPRTDLIGMTPSLLTVVGLAVGLGLASLLWLLAPRSVRSAA